MLPGCNSDIDTEIIIDSGSKCNIMNETIWNHMKRNKIEIFKQIRNPKKIFMAHGCKNPLEVLGSFETYITVGAKTDTAKFYVVKNCPKNLLGKITRNSLGLLELGLGINKISDGTFPKFKDVEITIPIDKSIKPVCQPYHKVPIPLESNINDKIEEYDWKLGRRTVKGF